MNEEKQKLGDFIRETRGTRTAISICDTIKFLFPNEPVKHISPGYYNRIESNEVHDVHPNKLNALAQVLKVDYYKLLYLAGYLDTYKELKNKDNKQLDKELDTIINVDKIFSNPNIMLHFYGNPIETKKRKAILTVLKAMILGK